MSTGVFRNDPRPPPKRGFIPSKAAASASLVLKPPIGYSKTHYNHARYIRQKFIPAKSTSLLFYSSPDLSRDDQGQALQANQRQRFVPAIKTSIVFDSNRGVGRDAYNHTLYVRQSFIPAISTSVVFNSKMKLGRDAYNHTLCVKQSFIPAISTSLVYASKLGPSRGRSKQPLHANNKFVPSKTAVATSLVYAKKHVWAERSKWFRFVPRQVLFGGPASYSLLYVPPRRIEQDIEKGIEQRTYYHYKPKDYYRIIGSVTPPPVLGSLVFKPKAMHWSITDSKIYYRSMGKYIRKLAGSVVSADPPPGYCPKR